MSLITRSQKKVVSLPLGKLFNLLSAWLLSLVKYSYSVMLKIYNALWLLVLRVY